MPRPVEEPEESTAIATGKMSGELPGSWTMRAEDSEVRFVGEESSTASLARVSGELLRSGELESRFVADFGEADTATGRLVLTGNVQVTSERDGVVLVASKVTYDDKRSLIIAEGSVEVRSDTWVSGPVARLVATAGLEKIGTPDRFGI